MKNITNKIKSTMALEKPKLKPLPMPLNILDKFLENYWLNGFFRGDYCS